MCFSLMWLKDLLIWLVIVGAIIAIIRLLVPWVMAQIGIPIIGQVLNIVLWAIIVIMVIVIVFSLLSCLMGGGGSFSFPRIGR